MEYINIISKEPITVVATWYINMVLGIVLSAICGLIIYCFVTLIKKNDFYKAIRSMACIGIVIVILEVVSICIGNAFFKVPTDRYKYEATIDKDKITVSQYEEFIEEYKPDIIDGIYYWEE